MYTFIINIYKDSSLADRLIDKLVELYPESIITVITDGLDIGYARPERNVVVYKCERTKTKEYGPLWLLRYINYGILANAKYIIKIDPDTLILDKFIEPPNTDIFGKLIEFAHGKVPTGGIYGIARTAAIKIIEHHQYFLSMQKYYKIAGYQRYAQSKHPHEDMVDEEIIIEEIILCDIIKRLGLSVSTWDGIVNRFRPVYTDKDLIDLGNVSAVHPYLGGK